MHQIYFIGNTALLAELLPPPLPPFPPGNCTFFQPNRATGTVIFCSGASHLVHTLVGGVHSKMEAGFSEPSPRWGQFSAVVEGKLCVYGGLTKDFLKEKSGLASSVHSFDGLLESWYSEDTGGVPPPGLYDGACASAGHHVYAYGGHDGSARHVSLHQLDTRTRTWKQLSSTGPMRKSGCRMVSYGSNLVLFGGFGIPSGPTQPGAEFVKSSYYTDGRGKTNELHTFDLIKGEGDVVASSA